jgi:hypothetical protein
VKVRLRPLSLAERGIETPTVSLGDLLTGNRGVVHGRSAVTLEQYVEEIFRSGFPGVRSFNGRLLRAQIDGYLDRIVDRDYEEAGQLVRRPETLRRWMAAYAAATSSVTTYEKIRAAAAVDGAPPARSTVLGYREVLQRLFILDPLPAWLPTTNRFSRLSTPPKHHLADPALAAHLLDTDATALLRGQASGPGSEGTLLGALFESLVTQSVRTYAQAVEARVSHLRTHRGDHEVDLIVQRSGRVLALEVKLTGAAQDHDARHLHWLKQEIGDQLLDSVIITSGSAAYRRRDGVAVVPAALLGP